MHLSRDLNRHESRLQQRNLFPAVKPDFLTDGKSFDTSHFGPSFEEPNVPLASSQKALEHNRPLTFPRRRRHALGRSSLRALACRATSRRS